MAACVICNQQTTLDDLQDVGDKVSLCARLEKVLDEVVPVNSVMCSSCEFDLAQIEMYYTLLKVFKKRYSDSAKLRLQSLPGDTSRNLLHETAGCTSNNLQSVFRPRDSSDISNTGLPVQSQVVENLVSPGISSPVVKLEILDVRTVKDEVQVEDSAALETLPTISGPLSHFLEDRKNQASTVMYGHEIDDSLQMVNMAGQPCSPSGDEEIEQTYSGGSGDATTWESNIDHSGSKTKATDAPRPGSSGQVIKKRGSPRKILFQKSGLNMSPGTVSKKSESSDAEIHRTYSDYSVEATAWGSDEDEAGSKNKYSKVSDATPAGSSGQVIKKRGRPKKKRQSVSSFTPASVSKKGESRKMKQSNVVSSLDTVAIPRKRGRPRKNEQPTGFQFDASTKNVNKRGRPKRDAFDSSTVCARRPGQTSKYKHASESQQKDRVTKAETSINFEESKSAECSVGGQATDESDAKDPSYDPKLSYLIPIVALKACVIKEPTENKSGDPIKFEESESDKCSLGGQNTDESDINDPSYDPKPTSSPTLGCAINEATENKTRDPITGGSKTNTLSIDTDPTTTQNAFLIGGSTTKGKYARSRKDRDPDNGAAVMQKKRKKTKKIFPCTKCNKVLNAKWLLKSHMNSHLEDRPFVCSVCKRTYKTINNLTAHKKTHMKDKPFKCDICGKAFVWKKLLKGHLVVHSDARPFQCDQCERNFKTRRNLTMHIRCHHVDGKKYLCNLCGLALFTEGTLRNHMKTHSDERPFKCETCGKGFISQAHLSYHEVIHNEMDTRKKFLCPVCGKELLQKSYLPIHMRQHTGEAKHTCAVCDKSFVSSNGYKRHMMMHRGDTPHICTECGKGFAGKGNLNQHMMSHTDERRHQCSCGQGFRTTTGLRRHMRTNKHARLVVKSVSSDTWNRQVSHTVSAPASVSVTGLLPTVLALPITPLGTPYTSPLPLGTPWATDDQHEMMSAYQN